MPKNCIAFFYLFYLVCGNLDKEIIHEIIRFDLYLFGRYYIPFIAETASPEGTRGTGTFGTEGSIPLGVPGVQILPGFEPTPKTIMDEPNVKKSLKEIRVP